MKQVDIIFMLDTSGSMSNEIEAVKQSCVDFADLIIREESSAIVRLGLVGFDIGGHQGSVDGPYTVHKLSSYTIGVWQLTTPQKFKKNVNTLRLGHFGGGGCYLANSDTVDIFPHVVRAFDKSTDVKRLLVIISDEIGTCAGVSQIVSLLNQASITAYMLGVSQKGKGAHEVIAKETEGRFWDISKGKYDFSSLFTEVATTIGQDLSREPFKFMRGQFDRDRQFAYTQPWSSTHPGCLIILIDQSGSMNDTFAAGRAGADKRKCDMVATVTNGLLQELILTNTVGQQVRPRAQVAVLGYEGTGVRNALSGSLATKTLALLPELKAEPLRIETRLRKELDDDNKLIEFPVQFPIWVEPRIGTKTPMCAALSSACDIAEGWAVRNVDHYPPVVVNITDGASTDGNPVEIANELRKIYTNCGETLLFNCHITHQASPAIEFPYSTAALPRDDDNLAELLFEISSVIPEQIRTKILAETGRSLFKGSRGFIFNGDAAAIRTMFTFATVSAVSRAIDPNR